MLTNLWATTYLEDFLEYPQDPAPTIARRIEERACFISRLTLFLVKAAG
ncbi:MAG: hypothetical protein GY862_05535 [Gammaproteobacteria bacterium]|nr:hypothetical protein [Gammaproteobacteria bacterium]